MLIKVCGMRHPVNICEVEALGIDWMGFIFWPHSSRYVSERPEYLPQTVKRVGVFVNATCDDICQTAETFGLDVIQLHGTETPAFIQQLRNAPATHSLQMVKAINVSTTDDLRLTEAYGGLVDYFLFDTKAQCVGGNGTQFDWSILTAYDGQTPFLLSGGIGPDDASRLSHFRHPLWAGIDLNSRFETAPAQKDTKRLRTFLNQLSHNNEQD